MRIVQKLKTTFLALALVAGGVLLPLTPVAVHAASPQTAICQGVNGARGTASSTACTGAGFNGFIKSVINLLLFVIGIAAVIMIIVGGIKYIVSGGDSAGITGAKNTILYAVVGLVVAMMAFAIVNFVVGAI